MQTTHYRLRDRAALATLLALLADTGRLRVEPERRLRRSFLDTFDRRLGRAGMVLETAEQSGGKTELMLRQHAHDTGEILTRSGLPSKAQDIERARLRTRLERLTAGRALLAHRIGRYTLHRMYWTDALDKRIASLDIEDYATRGAHAGMVLLRVRPLLGFARQCDALLAPVRRSGLLLPCRGDIADSLLAVSGKATSLYVAKPTPSLRRGIPAGTAVATLFDAYSKVMWINENGIVSDLDSEFLHDYRVALRSVRSWLGDLKGTVAKPARARFKVALARLNRDTGRLRDLDVLQARLPAYLMRLGSSEARPAQAVTELVASARRKEHARLVGYLASQRYRAFKREWRRFVNALAHGKETGRHGASSLKSVMLAALRRRHGRVMTFDWVKAHDDPQLLHELRKECKKLRYLLEGFQSLLDPKLVRRAIDELKTLQAAMGDTWDLHVHHALLRELTEDLPTNRGREVLPMIVRMEEYLTAQERAHCELVTIAFERFRAAPAQRTYSRLLASKRA